MTTTLDEIISTELAYACSNHRQALVDEKQSSSFWYDETKELRAQVGNLKNEIDELKLANALLQEGSL